MKPNNVSRRLLILLLATCFALPNASAAGIPPVNVRRVQKNDPLMLQGSGHPASALGAIPAESFASLQSIMVR